MGVEIDSQDWEIRLPAEKIQRTREVTATLLAGRTVTVLQLQSALGFLQWIARVVHGVRPLMWALRDYMPRQPCSQRMHVRLPAPIKRRLRMFLATLASFNGRTSIISQQPLSSADFATDACGSGGIGVFIDGQYVGLSHEELCELFPDAPAPESFIYVHETYAVLVAIRLFPAALAGQWILLKSDNPVTVNAINQLAHKELVLRPFLEEITAASWEHGFRISATHILGKDNGLADALSRQEWPRFHKLLKEWENR